MSSLLQLNDTHQVSARIEPVEGDQPRPRWSVMIPTYNCAGYLRAALANVLAQDPGPEMMQIEVIDDCSNADDPRQVVEELGAGRVGFFRQERNVGHVANFNTCIRRARGELVHILHGDDAVLPGFYSRMQGVFDTHPEIGNAFCRHIVIDEDGQWLHMALLFQRESGIIPNWLERIATGQRLQPPTMVVRRSVYEQLGGFDSRVAAYGEDWEMWVRIACHYPVWHDPSPLALYRVRTKSLSDQTVSTGANMRDLDRVVRIIGEYLPLEDKAEILRQARRNNALGGIRRARRYVGSGNRSAARAQLVAALKTSRSPLVLAHALHLVGRIVHSVGQGWAGR